MFRSQGNLGFSHSERRITNAFLLLPVLDLRGTITQGELDRSNVVAMHLWVAVHGGAGVDLSIRLPINGQPDWFWGTLSP